MLSPRDVGNLKREVSTLRSRVDNLERSMSGALELIADPEQKPPAPISERERFYQQAGLEGNFSIKRGRAVRRADSLAR